MLAQLAADIKSLTSQLEQSLANHNFIAGALQQAKKVFETLSATPQAISDTVSAVEDAVTTAESVAPAVVSSISTAEAAVLAVEEVVAEL